MPCMVLMEKTCKKCRDTVSKYFVPIRCCLYIPLLLSVWSIYIRNVSFWELLGIRNQNLLSEPHNFCSLDLIEKKGGHKAGLLGAILCILLLSLNDGRDFCMLGGGEREKRMARQETLQMRRADSLVILNACKLELYWKFKVKWYNKIARVRIGSKPH